MTVFRLPFFGQESPLRRAREWYPMAENWWGHDGRKLTAVQSTIIRLIDSLEPSPGTPPLAEMRRIYEIVRHRHTLRLTQEETADRLNLSVRHLSRLQREAIHVLTRVLWDQSQMSRRALDQQRPETVPTESGPSPRSGEWRAWLREELAALHLQSGENVAPLRDTMPGALHIARVAVPDREVVLETVPRDAEVALHPSVLRQVLLSATGILARAAGAGDIVWRAAVEGERARIEITGPCARGSQATDLSLAQHLLTASGGSVDYEANGQTATILIYAPRLRTPEDRITVLAVDDNPDLASVFQSYCAATPYDIVHIREGRQVSQAIRSADPAAILLDLMLPDVDGWDLLLDLHNSPETRTIPVIVCSVITDEQLALALGASLYLRKPVWRDQLIDALDQVISQAEGGCPRGRGKSVAID